MYTAHKRTLAKQRIFQFLNIFVKFDAPSDSATSTQQMLTLASPDSLLTLSQGKSHLFYMLKFAKRVGGTVVDLEATPIVLLTLQTELKIQKKNNTDD